MRPFLLNGSKMQRPTLKHNIMRFEDPNEIPSYVLAEALSRSEKYTDENGYEVELWGGDIHPTKGGSYGWVIIPR